MQTTSARRNWGRSFEVSARSFEVGGSSFDVARSFDAGALMDGADSLAYADATNSAWGAATSRAAGAGSPMEDDQVFEELRTAKLEARNASAGCDRHAYRRPLGDAKREAGKEEPQAGPGKSRSARVAMNIVQNVRGRIGSSPAGSFDVAGGGGGDGDGCVDAVVGMAGRKGVRAARGATTFDNACGIDDIDSYLDSQVGAAGRKGLRAGRGAVKPMDSILEPAQDPFDADDILDAHIGGGPARKAAKAGRGAVTFDIACGIDDIDNFLDSRADRKGVRVVRGAAKPGSPVTVAPMDSIVEPAQEESGATRARNARRTGTSEFTWLWSGTTSTEAAGRKQAALPSGNAQQAWAAIGDDTSVVSLDDLGK